MSAGKRNGSWFKCMRTPEALELIRGYPNAYLLASAIAHNTRCVAASMNPHGLKLGEAYIEGCKDAGLSDREYRTAKEQLIEWEFIAVVKTTNRATVFRLINTGLFAFVYLGSDEQETNKRRTDDEQKCENPHKQRAERTQRTRERENERTLNTRGQVAGRNTDANSSHFVRGKARFARKHSQVSKAVMARIERLAEEYDHIQQEHIDKLVDEMKAGEVGTSEALIRGRFERIDTDTTSERPRRN